VVLVLSKMKYPYRISKKSSEYILLVVHVSYTVEVRKYHTNCIDRSLFTFRKSGLDGMISFKPTYHRESVGLLAKH